VRKQQSKLPEAAAALREALRLQPDFAGAHTTLAAVLRQMGDPEGAKAESRLGEELSKARTAQQTAAFSTNSGRRMMAAGDLDGAIAQFQTALKAVPGFALAHLELSRALRQKGDVVGANRELKAAISLDASLDPDRQ
jgi:Tfp pilus assembly protein PilF